MRYASRSSARLLGYNGTPGQTQVMMVASQMAVPRVAAQLACVVHFMIRILLVPYLSKTFAVTSLP
jgi:hypothetical protein